MRKVVSNNLKFTIVFGRSIIKGEVVPLLGKRILIKYWSAAEEGVLNVVLKN